MHPENPINNKPFVCGRINQLRRRFLTDLNISLIHIHTSNRWVLESRRAPHDQGPSIYEYLEIVILAV